MGLDVAKRLDDKRGVWEFLLGLAQVLATVIAAYLVYEISSKQFNVAVRQLEPVLSSDFRAKGDGYLVTVRNSGHGPPTFTARPAELCQYTQEAYSAGGAADGFASKLGTALPSAGQLIEVPVAVPSKKVARKGNTIWAGVVDPPACPTGAALGFLHWKLLADRLYIHARYTDELGNAHERLFSRNGGATDPATLDGVSTPSCFHTSAVLARAHPTADVLVGFLDSLSQCTLVGGLP
jgi:hypothetical protein